jgi:hypothetical protein
MPLMVDFNVSEYRADASNSHTVSKVIVVVCRLCWSFYPTIDRVFCTVWVQSPDM